MALRCIYVLAFLLASQADGIALDGPVDDAASDLKKASKALNEELAEKPQKVLNVPTAPKKLPEGVRECEKYPEACKAEDLAKAKLEKALKEHPKRFTDLKVEDTKYNVKVIKTETKAKKVETKVVANKLSYFRRMAKTPDPPAPLKDKKEKEPEKKVVVEAEPVKNRATELEKKTEPLKKAEPEKKAKKEKKDTDTWFDRTVLGVKLPKLKLPFKLPWELKASQVKAAKIETKDAKTETKTAVVAVETKTQFLQVERHSLSGVERTVLKAGDGIHFPKNGDTVTMHYTGTLTDGGKKFDSSVDRGQPFVTQIGVGRVIKGWDEGVVKMSLGEKAVLKMTSDYGYGASGAGADIPPNAGLTFEVELLKIN